MSDNLEVRDVPEIPKSIAHEATEAFGVLCETLAKIGDIPKSDILKSGGADPQPQSFFIDPWTTYDSMGMNYRLPPGPLTFDMMRLASERNPIVASIHKLRQDQFAAFTREQANKFSVGFKVRPRGVEKARLLSDSDRRATAYITRLLLDTGLEFNVERDSFTDFCKKSVRDRLTYDQVCFEKVRTLGGDLHSFFSVDASTIRVVNPKNPKGTPPDADDVKREIRTVQVINGQKRREFTGDELAFCVANPRSSVKVYRYGLPEIEILMNTITSHLWAEQYNQRQFAQGSTIKGILNLRGRVPQNQLELLKKQWQAQLAGISNAWRTPVINAEGGMDFVPLQGTNADMGFQAWLEYCIKVISAVYGVDPSEINFDLRGGIGQQPMFMSNNEAQQKLSRDRGLQPLLRFFEDTINRHVVWPIDSRYEIAFLGLDARTEDQAADLRTKQVMSTYTVNEARALDDLPPIPHGDIILNPVYQASMAAAQQAQLQQQQVAAQAGLDGVPPPKTQEEMSFQAGRGEAEEKGAKRLEAFHAQGEAGGRDDAASIPEEELLVLRRDDWSSTVRSALPRGELRKACADLLDAAEGELDPLSEFG